MYEATLGLTATTRLGDTGTLTGPLAVSAVRVEVPDPPHAVRPSSPGAPPARTMRRPTASATRVPPGVSGVANGRMMVPSVVSHLGKHRHVTGLPELSSEAVVAEGLDAVHLPHDAVRGRADGARVDEVDVDRHSESSWSKMERGR